MESCFQMKWCVEFLHNWYYAILLIELVYNLIYDLAYYQDNNETYFHEYNI